MFKLKENVLRFGGKGDSHEKPMAGKWVRSAVGLLPVTPPAQTASAALGTGAVLPHKGCHSPREARLRYFPMNVKVSVLNWIQMEKPEVWWCLVPVAPYAAGPCPMFAVCGFIAPGMSH